MTIITSTAWEELTAKELHTLVWQYPKTLIAEHYGKSETAVRKKCLSLGVKGPGKGHWAKIYALRIPAATKSIKPAEIPTEDENQVLRNRRRARKTPAIASQEPALKRRSQARRTALVSVAPEAPKESGGAKKETRNPEGQSAQSTEIPTTTESQDLGKRRLSQKTPATTNNQKSAPERNPANRKTALVSLAPESPEESAGEKNIRRPGAAPEGKVKVCYYVDEHVLKRFRHLSVDLGCRASTLVERAMAEIVFKHEGVIDDQ